METNGKFNYLEWQESLPEGVSLQTDQDGNEIVVYKAGGGVEIFKLGKGQNIAELINRVGLVKDSDLVPGSTLGFRRHLVSQAKELAQDKEEAKNA